MCARCGTSLDAMPGIDISQLATLDDHGVHVAGRPAQALAPPPQAFGPPSPGSFGPPPGDAFAPPADAFGPGGEDVDAPIAVERSTRAIRIENEWQLQRAEKQAAAAVPPPKPPRQIGGVLIAVGLIAAVAIALVVIAMQPKAPGAAAPRTGVAAQPASR